MVASLCDATIIETPKITQMHGISNTGILLFYPSSKIRVWPIAIVKDEGQASVPRSIK